MADSSWGEFSDYVKAVWKFHYPPLVADDRRLAAAVGSSSWDGLPLGYVAATPPISVPHFAANISFGIHVVWSMRRDIFFFHLSTGTLVEFCGDVRVNVLLELRLCLLFLSGVRTWDPGIGCAFEDGLAVHGALA